MNADLGALRADVLAGRLDRRTALRWALAAGLTMAAGDPVLAGTKAPRHLRSSRTSAPPSQRVDYLIVGGGTAGAVLAHRLSADPSINVVLLEAGRWPDDPQIDTPTAWPVLQGGPYDWRYTTTPQAGLDGRVLPCPRGKGFGGSSLLNALGHQRGDARGYDRWQALGALGWTYDSVLPFHRRSETFSRGANAWRGGDGPLDVLAVSADRAHPVADAFLDAARAGGFRWSDDLNGGQNGEACWNQFTIGAGHRREHAARAYLEPIDDRANLSLIAEAPVQRLLIDRGRCLGVRYRHGDVWVDLRAERGVILAAGAIDSPRLLLRSGVGPAADLRSHDIEVVVDSPEVGANLHDHPLVGGIAYRAKKPLPTSHYNHGEGMLFTTLGKADVPDVLIMCVTVPFVIPSVGAAPEGGFTLVPCVMQPQSRGRVTLDSIDPATYRESSDLELMVSAVELARELARRSSMKRWIAAEVHPGREITDRAGLRAFVKRGTSPFYHPVGTVRMGRDEHAPATPDLAIRGVDGLWIADASVMPQIVPAMTNAATIAIAERGAELIRHAERR